MSPPNEFCLPSTDAQSFSASSSSSSSLTVHLDNSVLIKTTDNLDTDECISLSTPFSTSAGRKTCETQAPTTSNNATSIQGSNTSQEDRWIEQFRRKPPQILSERDLRIVCQRVKAILVEENNVQPVPSPVTICGDIHGQFYDLLELFDVGGQLPTTNYIFLGDYVDRGHNSVETFQYLLVLKLRYPANVTLLRGNHESRQITQVYGFYDECIRKYGNANPWRFCTDVFDYLTLAALVDGRVFCVHGGLSPSVRLMDQLRLIQRIQEIPHNGPFGDIVWSDPENIECWAINPRGAGWLFGQRVVEEFNLINDVELIARAHQLAMEGYQFMFGPESALVTVWSAPNYCYRCGNVAAILRLEPDMSKKFIIFRDTDDSRRSVSSRATVPYFL